MKSRKKYLTQYIHKEDRNLFITPVDHHSYLAACVKTYANGAVWDEFDHHKFRDTGGFDMFFYYELCDGEYHMRAYKEQKSGVLLLETGLWDYKHDRSDFDNLSVFQEKTTEDNPGDIPKEEYHFIVTSSFTIRGFDDLGQIAHNLIHIPKGTKFTWVKEGLEIAHPDIQHDLPVWHMISLRNAEIGIEVSLPTKYIGLVMAPLDITMEMPVDVAPYPYLTTCRDCKKSIGVPHIGPEVDLNTSCDIYAYDNCGEKFSIQHWLCDECYRSIFDAHQHTWSFQTEKQRFPYFH